MKASIIAAVALIAGVTPKRSCDFADGELLGAVDRLLADEALRGRMAAIASRVQAAPDTVKAANLVERLARDAAPVVG